MSYFSYRVALLVLCIPLSCLGIFFVYEQSGGLSVGLIREVFAKNIGNKTLSGMVQEPQKVIEYIPVQDIVSERYLYTLTRYIEERLSGLLQKSILLPVSYTTFPKVWREDDLYFFAIGNADPVSVPASNYMFQDIHTINQHTLSGESHIGEHSGAIQKPQKMIALTFDDGPSGRYTPTLLDILESQGVHATFFVLGSKAEQYPDILKRIHQDGNEVGNHSYSHRDFTKLSEREMQEEIYKTDQTIYHAIGQYPKLLRPPYGATNTQVLSGAHMPVILWSIDTRDWQTRNIKKNRASIKNAKDGDIIIMHDIHETSVASVADMIGDLKKEGFRIVTVSELLGLSETHTEIGKKCTNAGNCK